MYFLSLAYNASTADNLPVNMGQAFLKNTAHNISNSSIEVRTGMLGMCVIALGAPPDCGRLRRLVSLEFQNTTKQSPLNLIGIVAEIGGVGVNPPAM